MTADTSEAVRFAKLLWGQYNGAREIVPIKQATALAKLILRPNFITNRKQHRQALGWRFGRCYVHIAL
jgi:hypothetical protein